MLAEQVTRGEQAMVGLLLAALWLLALAGPVLRDRWEAWRYPAPPEPELVDWETNGWTSGDDEA